MSTKYDNIQLNYKIWLETQDKLGILGDGKWQLMKAISETGSLKLAMEKLNLSYRKTWNNLQQIEERLGFPILETKRGGTDGGGKTCLTADGERIVKAFDTFHNQFDAFIQIAFKDFKENLKKE